MFTVAIRKYGNEPAQTEVRTEDNDKETLNAVRKAAGEPPVEAEVKDEDRRPRR